MVETEEKYDGLCFVPEDDDSAKIVYFSLKEGNNHGKPIENSCIGDMFHVVLFKHNKEDGEMVYDDTFEAIFSDPEQYGKNLLPNFYAFFVRKTEKSVKWFEEYMRDLMERTVLYQMRKIKDMAENIANN